MKKTKNVWLVIISFFILASAVVSCSSKDSTPPVVPKPTITSFTPTEALSGGAVTITGTNFTGATAVSFGGSAAASFTVTNATTIAAVVGAGATGDVVVTTPGGTATLAGFTLKDPPIDGYDNSNEVGADFLRAHWTFDDTKTEDISGIADQTTSGTTAFSAGVIGKGIDLTNAYIIYNEIPNLDSADVLASFTLSLWAKIPDNTATLSALFHINAVNFQDIWPMIGIATRTNGNVYSLAAGTTHVNATGTHPTYDGLYLDPGTTPSEGFSDGADGWAYITVTYDGPSQTLTYFGNGVKLGSRVATNVIPPETLALFTPAKACFGTFEFVDDFADGIYGHPPAAADRPWASHGITGSLDDVRVFSSVLVDSDILALYHLGEAGR
jgi:IPT/TIG domain